MLIKPRFRGFICTTAHPAGCKSQVDKQIAYVQQNGKFTGPKKVLVIGASTGYGLASRIACCFGAGADTLGVFFEKPGTATRSATAGWYNTAAFEQAAHNQGFKALSVNGDAFSNEIKKKTIDLIKQELGKVDCIVYSLASPKRVHPVSGQLFSSVLKPIGQAFTSKTVDFHSEEVSSVSIQAATEEEIQHTVAVMGGEDWDLWMKALAAADVLAPGTQAIAYSYIGPELTYPIYREGTVGRAKDHLEATAVDIDKRLRSIGGRAFISVNKALVTQSSSAIPVVPLYMSLLFKTMKTKGTHENCIEQMTRLFAKGLYGYEDPNMDEQGRIRIDNLEMEEDVQREVQENWAKVNSANVGELSNITDYRNDFFKLFGFGDEDVNYEIEVNPEVEIPSIVEEKSL